MEERLRIPLLDEASLEEAVIGVQVGHHVPHAALDVVGIKRLLRCVGEMLENDGYIKSFIAAYADCHNVYYNDEEKDLFVIRRIQ